MPVTAASTQERSLNPAHPFLPPNFVDTNVHVAVTKLAAVGTIYVKFDRALPSDAKLWNMFLLVPREREFTHIYTRVIYHIMRVNIT